MTVTKISTPMSLECTLQDHIYIALDVVEHIPQSFIQLSCHYSFRAREFPNLVQFTPTLDRINFSNFYSSFGTFLIKSFSQAEMLALLSTYRCCTFVVASAKYLTSLLELVPFLVAVLILIIMKKVKLS